MRDEFLTQILLRLIDQTEWLIRYRKMEPMLLTIRYDYLLSSTVPAPNIHFSEIRCNLYMLFGIYAIPRLLYIAI